MSPRALVLTLLLIGAAIIGGCAGQAPPAATSIPTVALIPATATDVPTPVPPTNTPAALPAPGDVLPTPAPTSAQGESLVSQDPIAAELVAIAQRQIAGELDLPVRRVTLVEITPMVWTDSSLNCPLPDQTVTPMEIGGYRMVLEAADQTYVYHTDFDRVVRCDAANELLPTAEATA